MNVSIPKTPQSKALFAIFAMVFVFFIVLVSLFYFSVQTLDENNSENGENSAEAKIAVVEIEGVIMDSKDAINLLHFAEEDKKIQAIILRINSPGGAVGPTQEVYEEVLRIDKIKPIYASFGAIAASGGYYIGAAARKIWASPGTLTGSIGVIMEFMDFSKLIELSRVSPLTIKAGRYKDAGNPTRSMTEEEKGMMTNLIAGVHKQFINDIMFRRKSVIKKPMIELAQGQIFSGETAKEVGLIDEFGNLWTAGRAIHKDLKFKGKFGLKFIRKKKKSGILDILGSIDEGLSHLDFMSLAHMKDSPVLMFK